MAKRVLTAAQFRRATIMMVSIVVIAGAFLLWDFYLSAAKDIPNIGMLGYLTGPMFTHKLSEIIIAGVWLWFAHMYNAEQANLWPSWMPPERYRRSLLFTAAAVFGATVLATYSWTIINLGTSARTTNLADPPGIGEDWIVWRYYLGAVVMAGGAYLIVAMKKIGRAGSVSA
jgi:hypothetical protein